MQTHELTRLLATRLEPTPPGNARRRWTLVLLMGLAAGAALMQVFLGLQSGLATVAALPMFWVKLGLPLALCAGGLVAAARLARPGAALGAAPLLLATPLALVWALAAFVLVNALPAERSLLLYGKTWQVCPILIATLAMPTFAAAIWAMRGLAPTRLRLAGAAAGLLAGATGAFVYAFHCPEIAAPFIATWYVLGIFLPAAAGAVVGPRLLRW